MMNTLRNKTIYIADLGSCNSKNMTCLSVQKNVIELWQKRVGHVSFSMLNKLEKRDLVQLFPKVKFANSKVWSACVKGKENKSSFKPKKKVITSRPM